jgi:hypothetical protein
MYLSPRLILAPDPLVLPRSVSSDEEALIVWSGADPPTESNGIIEFRDWDSMRLLAAHRLAPAELPDGSPGALYALYHLCAEPFAPHPIYDRIVDECLRLGKIARQWPLEPNEELSVDLPDLDQLADDGDEHALCTAVAWPQDWRQRLSTDAEAVMEEVEPEAVEGLEGGLPKVKIPAAPPSGPRRLGVVIAGLEQSVRYARERATLPVSEPVEPVELPGDGLPGKIG